jgi:hypothetical protein
VVFNGVEVGSWRRSLDWLSPQAASWNNAHNRPEYESACARAIRQYVSEEDCIGIIGGGWGVTAVLAASQGTTVTVYEPGDMWRERVEKTININDVAESVTIQAVAVSHVEAPNEGVNYSESLSPADLPEFDFLEIDAEGAELDILSELEIRPGVITVETHGIFGCPPKQVREAITDLGYTVVDESVADSGEEEVCQEDGVKVLTAEFDRT